MPTQLTQTISLLYQMQDADIRQLESEILEARKSSWFTALSAEAARHGCNRTPVAPRRNDLAELRRMSLEDAESITATWNREVAAQIERIYADNPRANRNTYFSNLEQWDTRRRSFKLPQIALVTETTTAEFARAQFRQRNYQGDELYKLVGAAPVCAVCSRLFGAGIVTADVMRHNAMPAHINCGHQWEVVTPPELPCADMWLGE